jgi:putative flippase GtrA
MRGYIARVTNVAPELSLYSLIAIVTFIADMYGVYALTRNNVTSYLTAVLVCYVVAMVIDYVANYYLNFTETTRGFWEGALYFGGFALARIIFVLWMVHALVHSHLMTPLLARIASGIVAGVIVFIGDYFITFDYNWEGHATPHVHK